MEIVISLFWTLWYVCVCPQRTFVGGHVHMYVHVHVYSYNIPQLHMEFFTYVPKVARHRGTMTVATR